MRKKISKLFFTTSLCGLMIPYVLAADRDDRIAEIGIHRLHNHVSPQDERRYVEKKLLPVLQQIVPTNSAYKSYDTFVKDKGTGYIPGMNLGEYWDSWMKVPTYRKIIEERGLALPPKGFHPGRERGYIEHKLLPVLRKIVGDSPAYKSYDTFVKDKGTGYKPGMDMGEYWDSWMKVPKYKKIIEEQGLALPPKGFHPEKVRKIVGNSPAYRGYMDMGEYWGPWMKVPKHRKFPR
jgi:hypothetical protein